MKSLFVVGIILILVMGIIYVNVMNYRKNRAITATYKCPACNRTSIINTAKIPVGQPIHCPRCGAKLGTVAPRN